MFSITDLGGVEEEFVTNGQRNAYIQYIHTVDHLSELGQVDGARFILIDDAEFAADAYDASGAVCLCRRRP